MKTIKTLLITAFVLLCSTVASAHDFEVGGIYYDITSSSDLTVEVTYKGFSYSSYHDEYSGAVVIPQTVTYNSKTYSVTIIGEWAFYNCSGLTSITIPNSVTSMGNYAFRSCTGLRSVTIPNSVTTIGSDAFEYCTGLRSVTIPNSVTSIGDNAFYVCTGLRSVTIPNSVTTIGSGAFIGCTGLTSVTIPNSVTSIGGCAFSGCDGLKEVHISDLSAWCNIDFGDCYSNPLYYAHNLYLNGEKVTNLVIPNGVTEIKNYAFYGCTGLTSVTIPNSVTTIGRRAFEDCTGLKTVCNFSSLTLTAGSSANGYVAYYATKVINVPHGSIEGDFVFSMNDGVNTLRGYIGNGGDIVLPTDYKGENFVIGANAFKDEKTITSIVIPNSVTTIEYSAFRGCYGLTAVHISDLSAWCNIDFGGNYSNPLDYAHNLYLNGEKVTNLVIPNSVTTIGNSAFNSCSGLTNVTIPNSVTTIGSGAFEDCTGLTSVTIPNSVTTIGNSAFNSCSGLTNVTIPNSVTTIGEYAFYRCTGLTSVTIPNSVTAIGEYAFYRCTGLTSVTIPNSVTAIGDNAFSGCDIAKTIWLTNTPPSGCSYAAGKINYVANNQYTQLSNVVVYPYLSSLFEIDGIKYVPVSPAERTCDAIDCIYDTAIETVNIGKAVLYKNIAMNVKEVMPYTCYKNKNIRNLTISNDGSIGNNAFYACTELSDVTISNKGDVGASAFEGSATSGSAKIEISNDGSVGDKAFYGCTGLNDIAISNKGDIGKSAFESSATSGSVKLEISNDGSIGDKAFYGCTGLNDIAINNKGDIGASAFEGSATSGPAKLEISNDGSIGDKAFYACTGLSDITINNKGYIGTSAFEGCAGASEITLGDGITSIGRRAFYACSSLKEIIIPNSVTSLNSYVFYNCSALNSVALSDGIKTIGEYAFRGCSALPEIKIPQAVVEIGNYAFAGCSSLANVIIENREVALSLGSNGSSPLFADCPLDSVYIGGKINYNTSSSYGYSPFYRNTSLRSVVITDTEEQVYDNEFYGCSGLKNVQIGNGVKSIGKWAFSGCSSLDYLIVGANVSSIGQEAFSDCTNVTTIYSYATVPPVCGTQALEDINKWNCILLVPKESITKYQSAEQWKDFFFISEIPAETLPGDVNGDGRVSVADITTVVDAILNESTDTAYDVNGDSRVSVADITTIVDIILNEGVSSASKAPARVATRSSSALSLYIDPFEIEAGEEKDILVNLSNAGTEITAVEFDLFLPEGLEVVSDEYGYYLSPGSRTPNKRNPHAVSGALLSSGAIHVICYHNSQLAFTGEDGDVLAITIKASDDLEPGNYTIDLKNVELVNPADPTNGILISDNNTVVTDIENIEAEEEGTTVIYDLSGRKVAEPVKGGIYIINGKKVVL